MSARRPSFVEIVGGIARVHLRQGGYATIDVEDVPLVTGIAWQRYTKSTTSYAVRRYREGSLVRTEFMHRRLAKPSADLLIDHVDGDGLNNRRGNLRPCTKAENSANLSPEFRSQTGFAGVYRLESGRYQARISIDGRREGLGVYDTPEEAHEVYMDRRQVAPLFFNGAPARPDGR